VRNFGYQGFTKAIQDRIAENEDKLSHYRSKDNKISEERHTKLVETKDTVSMLQDKIKQLEDFVHQPQFKRCQC